MYQELFSVSEHSTQPDKLSDRRKPLVLQACQLHPDVALATFLARSFTDQLRRRDATGLDDWLQEADTCGICGLRGFSRGIRKDYAAVKAAFVLPWSNGQVEGQVNRLRFVTCV